MSTETIERVEMPTTGNAKIPDTIAAFIVRRLACYESYPEVIEGVKAEFGWELEAKDIGKYNCDNKGPRRHLGDRWVELFDNCRERFQTGLDETAIAYRPYRLKRLDEMERDARKKGNYSLAKELLEQAAREMGGFFDKGQGLSMQLVQAELNKLAMAVMDEVDLDTMERIQSKWDES